MDQTAQIGGVLGIVITVGGLIYGTINHKRLRSTCCGRKIDIALDIESTIPIEKQNENIKEIKCTVPSENGNTTQGV